MPKNQVRKLLPLKEQEIQKQILEYLKLKNVFCWKHNVAGIRKSNGSYIPSGEVGVSDIIGLLPNGTFLAIEVKRPGNKASFFQDSFIQNVLQNKGIAFVAYSVEDVINNLKFYGA